MAKKATARRKATARKARKKATRSQRGKVIDLSTLTSRTTIAIDGEPYEIRNRRELSVLQLRRLESIGATLMRLGDKPVDDITDEDDREASKALDVACRIVLIAPDEVHDRLCDADRLAINTVFTTASSAAQATGAGKKKAK